jgi:hypothetical protein
MELRQRSFIEVRRSPQRSTLPAFRGSPSPIGDDILSGVAALAIRTEFEIREILVVLGTGIYLEKRFWPVVSISGWPAGPLLVLGFSRWP